MINRADRSEMAALTRRYTGDEIGARAFDDGLQALVGRTDDPTVKRAAQLLWLISYWRHHSKPAGPSLVRLAPFNSFPDLAAVRRATPAFRKQPYRWELGGRQIRSKGMHLLFRLQWRLFWLLLGPLALLTQAFPEREERDEVLPEARVSAV
jgi:hypothetical protein